MDVPESTRVMSRAMGTDPVHWPLPSAVRLRSAPGGRLLARPDRQPGRHDGVREATFAVSACVEFRIVSPEFSRAASQKSASSTGASLHFLAKTTCVLRNFRGANAYTILAANPRLPGG